MPLMATNTSAIRLMSKLSFLLENLNFVLTLVMGIRKVI